ncbi:MAG TPA: hypothetical protein VGE35_02105 [Candidatus Paceibacterota bacterium]
MSKGEKITSATVGFWVIGFIYGIWLAPGSPRGYVLGAILEPYGSHRLYLFLGMAFLAVLAAGIVIVVSDKVTMRYPSRGLSVFLYGLVAPGAFWFAFTGSLAWLLEKYPNGF